jgi:hypothetical protein
VGSTLGNTIRGIAVCAVVACTGAPLSWGQNGAPSAAQNATQRAPQTAGQNAGQNSVPTGGQKAAPLGVVQQANRAHLGPSLVTEGATLYAGETLSTDSEGVLELQIGSLRFGMPENSQAAFHPRANGSVAELARGTLTFKRDADGADLEIVASDVRIVPEGDGAVMGQVTIVSQCKIKVTSLLGQLDVVSGKEKHTIKEKETYSVMPEVTVLDVQARISPDDTDYHRSHSHKACAAGYFPRGGPPGSAGSSRFLLLAGTIAAVATGVGVYLATESPDKP